jgi:hypothetical protein
MALPSHAGSGLVGHATKVNPLEKSSCGSGSDMGCDGLSMGNGVGHGVDGAAGTVANCSVHSVSAVGGLRF